MRKLYACIILFTYCYLFKNDIKVYKIYNFGIFLNRKAKIMKNTLLFLALALISLQVKANPGTDVEEIKRVIDKAYIDGIQNWGDPDVIRQYFVPEFVMLMLVDNEIRKMPIGTWISNMQRQKQANPDGPPFPATVKYLDVDVAGTAAMVKLELYRQGRREFTDYLALYKFEEGWKIVGKTFFRH
jgi:hypothetical protein